MNTKLIDRVTAELSPIDQEEAFDDMLRECYSFDSVGGPFASLDPARVLREMSPTDYRCGVADYTDSQSDAWVSLDNGCTYYPREGVEELRDEIVRELEEEMAEAEREADSYDADGESGAAAAARERMADRAREIEELGEAL